MSELFKQRIVSVVRLDNGISDEVTLQCGHTIIRICPVQTDMAYCSECLHEWLEKQKTGTTAKDGK